jgi:hypothetical protein
MRRRRHPLLGHQPERFVEALLRFSHCRAVVPEQARRYDDDPFKLRRVPPKRRRVARELFVCSRARLALSACRSWLNPAISNFGQKRGASMEIRDKLGDGVRALRPQIERLAADKELHEHLKNAYTSGRVIYLHVFPARRPSAVVRRLSGDPKLHRELARGIEELRAAGGRIQSRRGHNRRNATLFVSGLGLAVLFNPLSGTATRRWLKARLSGSEETARYQPNGSPAQAEAAAVSSRPTAPSDMQAEAGSGGVDSAERSE